jgi:UDP-glucose 4-epimerase
MILITGGNGYIGTAISEILIDRGEEFRILDNFSGSSPLNMLFLRNLHITRRNEIIWGDIRNFEELQNAFRGVDAVLHLAAKLPAAPGMVDETGDSDINHVNYHGTLNVLELARKHDVKVIFASTCNVYGIGVDLDEESEPKPLNRYAESKLEAEKACIDYRERYGLDVKILRLASVYGYSPGVRFNLVANYFVLRAVMGYPLTVFGDGSNFRPFVHVRDAANAFLFFIENGKAGEIYNIGCENLRIRDVAEIVRKEVNPSAEIVFTGKKPEFSYHVKFDRASNAGFTPEFNLADGVRELAGRLESLRNLKNLRNCRR